MSLQPPVFHYMNGIDQIPYPSFTIQYSSDGAIRHQIFDGESMQNSYSVLNQVLGDLEASLNKLGDNYNKLHNDLYYASTDYEGFDSLLSQPVYQEKKREELIPVLMFNYNGWMVYPDVLLSRPTNLYSFCKVINTVTYLQEVNDDIKRGILINYIITEPYRYSAITSEDLHYLLDTTVITEENQQRLLAICDNIFNVLDAIGVDIKLLGQYPILDRIYEQYEFVKDWGALTSTE